jgi:hypothetical protein
MRVYAEKGMPPQILVPPPKKWGFKRWKKIIWPSSFQTETFLQPKKN